MKRLKVITAVGTRPEIIRLSRVMAKLDESEVIQHITVHTGQNYDYELNQIFYDDLGIRKPDYYLDAAGKRPAETIGQVISKVDPVLEKEKPDAFLVLGDTNSCLCAIPAKRRHIPVFHMEAGNRCFDQRVPEELNRKIVDHIADINLPYSNIAREFLLREGIPPDRIIKTGSPMYEVLQYYMPRIQKSDVLTRLNLKKERYFVVSAHREENVDNEKIFENLLKSLNIIAEKYKFPIIVSTHPRTRKRLEKFLKIENTKFNPQDTEYSGIDPLIQFLTPLSFTDYINLQMNSFAVLSDSGTISEEASILNLKALNIREAHERPEAMEEAVVMMVGLKPDRVLQGLIHLRPQKASEENNFRIPADYAISNVSDKIVRIILSHIDYIKRVSWGLL